MFPVGNINLFICIVFCILFGQIVFMTVFRLGLSMFQIYISWFWRIFILSSFHRPLLSLTLVLIAYVGWEGPRGGAVRVVLRFVCVRLSFHLGRCIDVRIGVGLVCVVWSV